MCRVMANNSNDIGSNDYYGVNVIKCAMCSAKNFNLNKKCLSAKRDDVGPNFNLYAVCVAFSLSIWIVGA